MATRPPVADEVVLIGCPAASLTSIVASMQDDLATSSSAERDLSRIGIDAFLAIIRERPLLWIGAGTTERLSMFLNGFCTGQHPEIGGANAHRLTRDFGLGIGKAFGIQSFFDWSQIVAAVASRRGIDELALFWQLWDEFCATGSIETQPTSFDLYAELVTRFETQPTGLAP